MFRDERAVLRPKLLLGAITVGQDPREVVKQLFLAHVAQVFNPNRAVADDGIEPRGFRLLKLALGPGEHGQHRVAGLGARIGAEEACGVCLAKWTRGVV